MSDSRDEYWMSQAYLEAQKAAEQGEVPVGALIVLNDELVATGCNRSIIDADPSAHAEIVTIRAAAKVLNNYRLINSTLYVTLEPCLMCVGAMVHARVKRLVFGAYDPKSGVANSCAHLFEAPYLNHRVVVEGGILRDKCGQILSDFFKARR